MSELQLQLSLIQAFGVAIVAGLVAGFIAPYMTSTFARRNWQRQKTFELKYEIFRGATVALAAWAADALDVGLQKNKATTIDGLSKMVEMRPETAQALEQHRGLLQAFFSEDVANKYDLATKAEISIKSVPCTDFEEKRIAFIEAASNELGLRKR